VSIFDAIGLVTGGAKSFQPMFMLAYLGQYRGTAEIWPLRPRYRRRKWRWLGGWL